MRMPTSGDYREALQHPHRCFASSELQTAIPKRTKLGLPAAVSGNFAVVFELQNSNSHQAVRCFIRNVPDVQLRYQKIAAHLEMHRESSESLVHFEYVPKGIRVGSEWYPIVIMDWVEGEPLDVAVERRLYEPEGMRALAENWLRLDRELTELGIAHGDLQHGNVIVSKGDLKLVDYDGMFVPAFRGQAAPEAGHANFQSPHRNTMPFNEYLDRFSSLSIYTALRALQSQPELWHRHGMPDDALLFRRKDFEKPEASALIAELSESPDPVVPVLVRALLDSLTHPITLNNLDMIVSSRKRLFAPDVTAEPGDRWWRGRLRSDSPDDTLGAPSSTATIYPQHTTQPQTAGWWKNASDPPPQDTPQGYRTRETRPTVSRSEAIPQTRVSAPNKANATTANSNANQALASQRASVPTRRFIAAHGRRKFHLPTCEYGGMINKNTGIWFDTVEDAQRQGYLPCRVCNPTQLKLPQVAHQVRVADRQQNTKLRPSPQVSVGCTVEVRFDRGDIEVFKMVEKRNSPGEVSVDSPIGQAVLGHRSGDAVRYQTPLGIERCTIVNVQ